MSRGVGHDQVTSRGPFKPLSPSQRSSGTWAEERTPTLLLSFSAASRRPCWFSSCMQKGEQGLRVCSPSPRGPGAPPHLPYAAGAPCCWPFVRSSAQNLCWLLHRSPEPLLPAGMGNHQIPCHRHTPPCTWHCPSFPCPSAHQPSAHPHPASGPARPPALCPARPALPGCPGHGGGGWRGGTRDLHYCAFLCLSLQEVCLGEEREQERLREGQGPNPSIVDAISQSPPQPCRCPWLLGCTDPALAPPSLTLPGQASFSPVPSAPLPGGGGVLGGAGGHGCPGEGLRGGGGPTAWRARRRRGILVPVPSVCYAAVLFTGIALSSLASFIVPAQSAS